MENSWHIFDNWNYKDTNIIPHCDWSIFDELSSSLSIVFTNKMNTLNNLKTKWDKKLKQYGGNTSNYNWNKFRPLRLSREEDWSDWLIYLISESKTGYFSYDLFHLYKFDVDDFSYPLISDREISFSGHRADIVIQWRNKKYTHVEVKIGDENLSKTYSTAKKMRSFYKVPENKWYDFILLLEYQVNDWLSVVHEKGHPIQYITWNNVAISLRRSLIYSEESITWKVWAYSFLGAIEHKLLNVKNQYKVSDILHIDNTINILKEGLNNGK